MPRNPEKIDYSRSLPARFKFSLTIEDPRTKVETKSCVASYISLASPQKKNKICRVMTVQLQNINTGFSKVAPLGFSWTTFFFGAWVPLLRGETGEAFKTVALSVITLGIYNLFFSASYNKQYIQRLLMQGFQPANDQTMNMLQMNGIMVQQMQQQFQQPQQQQ